MARGRIVHPTSSTVPIFDRDDVVLIPIDDLPPLPLGLVWCRNRENPRIRALNEIAGPALCPGRRRAGGQMLRRARSRSARARIPTSVATPKVSNPCGQPGCTWNSVGTPAADSAAA